MWSLPDYQFPSIGDVLTSRSRTGLAGKPFRTASFIKIDRLGGIFCFPTPPSSKGHFRQTHFCALPQLNNHTLPISVPSFWSDPGTEESDWGWQALSSSSAPWAKSCSCHHCLSCQTALEGLAVLKSISVAWNKWKSFFQVLPHPWMPCPALLLPAGPLEFPFQFSFPSYSWGGQKFMFTALYPWVSALSPSLGDILS